MFGTKVQTKTRKNTSAYWKSVDWEESNERPKWMLGIILVNYIICLVPIVNLIWSIFFLRWYIKQLKGPCWDNGNNLVATRITYSNKFTKWLTKKV